MRRAGLLALGALLLAACGGSEPIAGADLRVAVSADPAAVAPGKAFPLTVVRAWKKGETPSVWSDRALAPLAVRLESAALREDGRLVEETRSFAAYAFSLTDVVVPQVPFAARAPDGSERRASAPPLRVAVRPTLDPASPGPPEPPEGPLDESSPKWPRVAGALAALCAAAVLLLRRARTRAGAAPPPPAAPATLGDGAERRALEALAGLSDASPDVAVPAAAEVLRVWLAERHALPALKRTTPETLTLAGERRGLHAAARAALAEVLRAGDAVKFGGSVPSAAERAQVLTAAEDVVRAGSEDAL